MVCFRLAPDLEGAPPETWDQLQASLVGLGKRTLLKVLTRAGCPTSEAPGDLGERADMIVTWLRRRTAHSA